MSKPLCIDLFCGCFGWSAGWLAEGGRVVGFDLEHLPHHGPVPEGAELVLQDVLTVHGRQFRNADLILASPPCQTYSYMAQPWKRAKREVRWQRWERDSPFGDRLAGLRALFDACFRIQREANQCESCSGTGQTPLLIDQVMRHRDTRTCGTCGGSGTRSDRYVPMIVENVKGAQPWVGRAKWHYGSYYLWGDVPALMPITLRTVKREGRNFHFQEKYGIPSPSFHGAEHEPSVQRALDTKNNGTGVKCGGSAGDDWFTHHNRPEFDARAQKNNGGSWFAQAHNTESGHSRNPVTGEGQKGVAAAWFNDHKRIRLDATYAERKANGDLISVTGSRSSARKAASAQIAKIPFDLASHIARCFKPQESYAPQA